MAAGAARPAVDLVLRRQANRLHAAPLGSDGGQLPCKLIGGAGQSAVDHGAGKRKNTENSVARQAQCEEWRWTERAGSRVGSSGYQSASQRSPYQDVAFGSAVCSCRSNRSSGNPILNKATGTAPRCVVRWRLRVGAVHLPDSVRTDLSWSTPFIWKRGNACQAIEIARVYFDRFS
jgi:hypothetical protein